jgi:DNA-3-methyladenine glycosylase I
MSDMGLQDGADGVRRCWWCGETPDYVAYHDDEWGRPVADDTRLFEKICLEGFQSGLSWLTILRKRENFRAAFAGFDVERVAGFGAADVERLLGDSGIIRHRGKIEATINNAGAVRRLRDETGASLAAYIWRFEPEDADRALRSKREIPGKTAVSEALAKDLKKRGFRFFGPTTAYAFMQSMGLVNDHLEGCAHRAEIAAARAGFSRPRR